ncbi:MAG: hypothetical protein CVU84_09690 [Firmicutes bacterium HGW-Firmicutes-1]|jgi:hypothetical protein|nr:MAG: hypothetical protein CVU84_09690 [Firmicutes bacterium HGW-Firmicutes-1]
MFKKKVSTILIMSLLISLFMLNSNDEIMASDSDNEEKHWVYDELDLFKQRIAPIIAKDATYYTLNEDEKEHIINILNEQELNNPIKSKSWGILLKAVLKLPEAEQEMLINMYVHGLSTGDEILREDAVGGMLKLLSINYYDGLGGNSKRKEIVNVLKDQEEVSEKQDSLVEIAYNEGFVDSNTKNYFRPKDKLTVAEAISMLNNIMIKYDITYEDVIMEQNNVTENNNNNGATWIDIELKLFENRLDKKAALIQKASTMVNYEWNSRSLDEPIDIKTWAELLSTILELDDENAIKGYTYNLVSDNYVPRDIAIAGMVKLLYINKMLDGRDATNEERLALKGAFSDCLYVFDESKLAIAYNEGLVKGNQYSMFEPKRMLTKGEALILLIRVIDKYETEVQ